MRCTAPDAASHPANLPGHSTSGSGGGDCVEVAVDHNTVCVRDSKAADAGPVLRIERGEWAAFVTFARG
ncbi:MULTISPECIES: DUF397 domain-containing protein [unclassified Streptomyces]|uniref:DUF397 domain-containing protein n=1 Tax=unclassified Streptomyces TaxID=2593676 RepID=UPI00093B9D82|nr:DUF397 domain-containing protein [Streptomyces sp. CB01580]OKJ24679.1 hypothetical protein AMK22_34025 [Streptomyces sp. CB01580]